MADTWLTSDLHFSHHNIINYTSRPFAGPDEMNGWLIDKWNTTVKHQDVVWVLGDVCMGPIDHSLQLVGELNGRLRLIVGNHDRMFKDDGRRHGWEARYVAAGFESIVHGATAIDMGLPSPTRACHFPYQGDTQPHDRHMELRPLDDGKPLVHGHTHGLWRQNGGMVDVGVDAWAGAPVHADTIAALLNAGPAQLPALPWVRGAAR